MIGTFLTSTSFRQRLWDNNQTKIGQQCRFGLDITIHNFCNIYGETVIGKNSAVGSYVEISGAKIGNNVTIGAYSFIPAGVSIGDDVFVGPGVHFTHELPPVEPGKWQPVTIGNGVLIGSKALIMPGVTIGAHSVIGAGAIVTKDVPEREVWAGVPAKKLKDNHHPEQVGRWW